MTNLFLKIIERFLFLIEIFLSIIFLVCWTLAYPLLRLRYNESNKYKHHPSVVLFRLFLWASNLFNFDYFKK